MLIHRDALIDLNNMGNIILLRKSNTHHHHDRVGRHLSSFRVRNVLYLYLYLYLQQLRSRKSTEKKYNYK